MCSTTFLQNIITGRDGQFSLKDVKGAKFEMPNVEDNLPDDLHRWLRTRGLSASMSESKACLVKR